MNWEAEQLKKFPIGTIVRVSNFVQGCSGCAEDGYYVGQITKESNDSGLLESDNGINIIGHRGNWRVNGTIRKATLEEISEYTKRTFKIGDWVYVVKSTASSSNKTGDIMQVSSVKQGYLNEYTGLMTCLKGSFERPQDIRKATLEEIEEQIIKVGSYDVEVKPKYIKVGCKTYPYKVVKQFEKAASLVRKHGAEIGTNGDIHIEGEWVSYIKLLKIIKLI